MSGPVTLQLKPAGPVAAKFMASKGETRMIMGPIGSGKTSACLFDMINKGLLQPRSPIDGRRYAKFAVIRDTYRNLAKTTIKSWLTWFPKTMGKWAGGGNGEPASHEILFDLGGDIGEFHLTVEFIALGEHSVESVMRGWEGTGAYLNEADTLDPDVLDWVSGRCGRYPSKAHGGCRWSGVWADCNAPSYDNWVYDRFVKNRATSLEFYQQPGAMIKIGDGQYQVNPAAENLGNLPSDYYAKQIKGKQDWYIRRMILNLFGYSRKGKPVYENFNDQLHVAEHDLPFIPELPLIIGMDAGNTPAAIFLQQLADGQWRCLDELIPGHITATPFGRELNQKIHKDFPGARLFAPWCDPSADFGGSEDDLAWKQIVEKETGLRIRPAPTNNIQPRLDAVGNQLNELIEGRKPRFFLSPKCIILRRGFNDGYRYKKLQGGSVTYDDKPEKNEYSHPHDALQYGVLGGGEYAAVMGRRQQQVMGHRPMMASTDFNPLG